MILLLADAPGVPTQAMNQLENMYHGYQQPEPMLALGSMAVIFLLAVLCVWWGVRK